MAKVKVKNEKTEGGNLPEGVKIIDLSPEKRVELYQKELQKFDSMGVEVYGVSVGVEMVYSKSGIIPRMVLVDVLTQKKENETKATQENSK